MTKTKLRTKVTQIIKPFLEYYICNWQKESIMRIYYYAFRYKVWFARFKGDSNLPKIKTPNIVHLVNSAYGRQTYFIQFMIASHKSEIWISVNQTNKHRWNVTYCNTQEYLGLPSHVDNLCHIHSLLWKNNPSLIST